MIESCLWFFKLFNQSFAYGSVVVIGTPWNDGNGSIRGHVRLYQIDLHTTTQLTELQAITYIASNPDLINAFGTNTTSAKSHYLNNGKSEGGILDDFDEWGYLASNNELINTLGSDTTEAVKHYISFGHSQGKITNSFDAQSYLNNYEDLRNAFGDDQELATKNYVEYGFIEGNVF